MQDITRDLFVSIAVIGAIFGILYVFLMTRYRERMSMLEKGIDPTMFASKSNTRSQTLKLGMLSVGVAIGILLGNLLYEMYWLDKTAAYMSMIFLFGGISLIINFLVDRKIKN